MVSTGTVAATPGTGDPADLLQLAMARPSEAVVAAHRLVRERRSDARTLTYCHHALGIVARDAGEIPRALSHLRKGFRIAEREGLTDRVADIEATLGTVLVLAGRVDEGMQALDRALAASRGLAAARVRMRRGGVLYWAMGRHEDALKDFRAALPVFRRHGETVWEARALYNRGYVLADTGRLAQAEADLLRSDELYEQVGERSDAAGAGARLHLAWVAYKRGDLPSALSYLDAVGDRAAEMGHDDPEVHADRGTVLLAAGLAADATDALQRALTGLPARGAAARRAMIQLQAARAARAAGDLDGARAMAQEAARTYRRLRNDRALARARLEHLRARVEQPTDARGASAATGQAARAAAQLAADPALETEDRIEAHLLAGRFALARGDGPAARAHLAAAASCRQRGTPMTQSRGWLAAALRGEAAGRSTDVLTACQRGLDVLDEHRLTLGATELRAAATAHGTELADLGLRHALADGDPRLLLMWSERWRATTLAIPPVRPPDDRALAADLTALREVARDLEKARTEGAATARLERERRRLEEAARARTLRVRGEGSTTEATTSPDELLAALDGATLVEVVAVDGDLHVLLADSSGVRRHAAGALGTVAREVDLARFSLHQLARGGEGPGAAALRRSAERTLPAAAERLQDLLLAGAAGDLGDGPVVVVPPGRLHAVPWGLLPAFADRAVSVAPSAAMWLRGRRRRRPVERRVALVAGPDLGTGGGEVPQLAALYPEASLLRDGAATAEAVLEALDGAWLAHVAAHGTFRADNPMFSSLRMDDGPLTVHDLCRLQRAPYRLILSSCESGLAAPTGADELLGLTSALVPLGTVSLLASVVPVNDEASVPLMGTVHHHLRRGASLAEALREARLAARDSDAVAAATAAAFVALGSA